MKIIYDEDYILEEPCVSCEKCYIEDIWNEYCCDEEQCIHQEEYLRAVQNRKMI